MCLGALAVALGFSIFRFIGVIWCRGGGCGDRWCCCIVWFIEGSRRGETFVLEAMVPVGEWGETCASVCAADGVTSVVFRKQL